RGADQAAVDRVTEEARAFLNKGHSLPQGAKIKLLTDHTNQSDLPPQRRFILYTTVDRSSNPARVGHFESLLKLVEQGLENCTLRGLTRSSTSVASHTQPKTSSHRAFGSFVVESQSMRKVLERIQKIPSSDVTVMITGDSGVGKELIARSIHYSSTRQDKPFLPFNCAAVPAELVESRLFGHRRGSFTGADKDSQGIVRAATGGPPLRDDT